MQGCSTAIPKALNSLRQFSTRNRVKGCTGKRDTILRSGFRSALEQSGAMTLSHKLNDAMLTMLCHECAKPCVRKGSWLSMLVDSSALIADMSRNLLMTRNLGFSTGTRHSLRARD